MPATAIIVGLILIGIGIGGSMATGWESVTSLIPAFIGVILGVLGLIGMRGGAARRHSMHVAAALGVLGALGSLGRIISKLAKGDAVDFASIPVILQITTSLVLIVFVVLCVRSFIAARRGGEAGDTGGTA